MKRALVLTNHLHAWAGSEILALEVCETLKETHNVSMVANVVAEDIRTLCEKQGFTISDEPNEFNLCDFDFVWAQHLVAPLCKGFSDLNNFNGSFNSVHLSPFEPFELASLSYMKNLGSNIVTNSKETLQKINSWYSEALKIHNFNNATIDSFFEKKQLEVHSKKRVESVLVVSNHIPSELSEASETLTLKGIRVEFFGIGQKNYQRITKEIIQQFDAVVTIGKTVQNSILARRPVYCYDRFGGPGYISPDNFELSLKFNFSGRCCGRKLSAIQLCEEILSGYEDAVANTNELFEIGRQLFSLTDFIDKLAKEKSRLTVQNLCVQPFIENSKIIRQHYIKAQHDEENLQRAEENLRQALRNNRHPLRKLKSIFIP